MHKAVAILISAGLVAGLSALPATAGPRKKTVKEQWQVAAAPFPGADDHSDPSQECGVEGASYAVHAFTTPAKGTLDVRINGFEGEWDLYVTDAAGHLLGSSVEFMSDSEERVVLRLGAKVKINIYACNFLGGPIANGELKYVYR